MIKNQNGCSGFLLPSKFGNLTDRQNDRQVKCRLIQGWVKTYRHSAISHTESCSSIVGPTLSCVSNFIRVQIPLKKGLTDLLCNSSSCTQFFSRLQWKFISFIQFFFSWISVLLHSNSTEIIEWSFLSVNVIVPFSYTFACRLVFPFSISR